MSVGSVILSDLLYSFLSVTEIGILRSQSYLWICLSITLDICNLCLLYFFLISVARDLSIFKSFLFHWFLFLQLPSFYWLYFFSSFLTLKLRTLIYSFCVLGGLKSGLYTCKTGALLLDLTSSPFYSGYFGDWVLQTICPRVASNSDPPNLSLPNH
jgi:hypothetical protein